MKTQGDLLEEYYAQEQEVQNLQRALHDAEVQLEKIRRQILPEIPSTKPKSKEQ